jgi:ribosomal-protein-alanine N-acetyltransferase
MQSMLQKFFSRFPVIELGEVRLRDLMLSDREGYFKMMSDPEGTQYISDEDVPKSLEDTDDEIKYWGGLFYRKQSIFWAIADSKTDEFMGTIGFNNWNFHNQRAEVSYDLMREHWRKGIMTKVLRNIMIFGFKNMNLYRVEARTMLDNQASKGLLEKVGFKQEGVQRAYRIIRGHPADITLYGLIKKDYSGFLAE